MHEGAYETDFPRPLGLGIWHTVRTNPRTGLNFFKLKTLSYVNEWEWSREFYANFEVIYIYIYIYILYICNRRCLFESYICGPCYLIWCFYMLQSRVLHINTSKGSWLINVAKYFLTYTEHSNRKSTCYKYRNAWKWVRPCPLWTGFSLIFTSGLYETVHII